MEWTRPVDIRRIKKIIHEVDKAIEMVSQSETMKQKYRKTIEIRVRELENFVTRHQNDAKSALIQKQAYRLRQVLQPTLPPSHPVSSGTSSAPTSPSTSSSCARPIYKWETIRNPIEMTFNEKKGWKELKEPGHYENVSCLRSKNHHPEEVVDLEIIFTAKEWQSLKFQERTLAAETRHYQRQKQSHHEQVATEPSLLAATPFIDRARLDKTWAIR